MPRAGRNVLTVTRNAMGAKLFEALVGLRHNAPLIKRWVDGEVLLREALAHATDLASDVESMAEREEINRMIAAIKMEAKI